MHNAVILYNVLSGNTTSWTLIYIICTCGKLASGLLHVRKHISLHRGLSVPMLLISCKPVTIWVMKDLTILLHSSCAQIALQGALSDMQDEIDSYLQQWFLYHTATILNLQKQFRVTGAMLSL